MSNGQEPVEMGVVQPQPGIPFTYQVGRATTPDGREFVAVQFLMVTGSTIVFFNKDDCNNFIDMLKKHVSGLSGIIVTQAVPDMKMTDEFLKKIKGQE